MPNEMQDNVFVSSTMYYDNAELTRFCNAFSQFDIKDKFLKHYVEALNTLLKKDQSNNLGEDENPELRKLKTLALVCGVFKAIPNKKLSDDLIKQLETYANIECDISLANDLIDRYCWDAYLEQLQAADKDARISFADKLAIKPITVSREEKLVIPLSEVVVRTDNNEIYPTNIPQLDEIVKMRRTNFAIIAARTTVGKSLFMLNHAVQIADYKKVLYVSLEESAEELKKRVESRYTKETPNKRRVMNNLLLYTPDTSSPDTILSLITEVIKKEKIEVVFLDYIQLLKYNSMDDWASLRSITRELKIFANSQNVLLVTASQLKREAEYTGANMTGLFGSSTLEADANIVIILESTKRGAVRSQAQTEITINVTKNRGGQQAKLLNIPINYENGTIG